MYCSKCGSMVNENANFCHNCGKSINVKTVTDPDPKITEAVSKDFKISDIKLPFSLIVAYAMEWLGIIISLFTPICAYYSDHGKKDISHYCTVFGGSWAYINDNYNPISTPEKGHHYARFFAIIFLVIAILCLLIAILKKGIF